MQANSHFIATHGCQPRVIHLLRSLLEMCVKELYKLIRTKDHRVDIRIQNIRGLECVF